MKIGEDADLALHDAAVAQQNAIDALNAMHVDESNESDDEDTAPVKLVVLDGIVMGPTHCAFEKCTSPLANMRHGVFCAIMKLSVLTYVE